MNARAILNQAISQSGASPTSPAEEELAEVATVLCRTLAIFVKDEARERATNEVRAACRVGAGPILAVSLAVQVDVDVAHARSEARRVCEALSGSSFTIQRVTTITSELARNIISYTPGGTIHLEPLMERPPRVRLIAQDIGKGIANLDEIMSGTYRSRTGMGKGIAGCKRMADAFHIETGPAGTRVEVEVRL